MLSWSTSTEIYNDYFLVEKRFDAFSFSDITTITGTGNSNKNINYSHIDQALNNQTAYYRLKQVDFNGDFEYSIIIAVSPCSDDAFITVYPNPFKEPLNIAFPEANGEKYSTEITDYLGRIIIQEEVINNTGTCPFNIEEIQSKGFYFITIKNKDGDQRITQKNIKQ